MSDKKTISIPSLTEGKEPYQVVIPKVTAIYHRKMMLLETANQIAAGKEACVEAVRAVKSANESRDAAKELIAALKEMEADPAFIASKMDDFTKAQSIIDEMERKLDKTKEVLDKDIIKVEKHFGNIPDLDIDEVALTYLLIGKDLLGEPWAVMACCKLDPEVWIDIDYDDYAQICKELLRRNPRFFRVRHQKSVA